MDAVQNKKENVFSLPEIEIKRTLPIRFINRSVSITFLIIVLFVIVASVIVFSVKTNLTISADGILSPSKIIHLHSPESGLINEILVKSGDTVKVNQVLVTLDSLELKKNLFDIQSQIATDENAINKKMKNAAFDKTQNQLELKSTEAGLIKSKASFRDRISSFFPKANLDSLINNYKPGENITLDYAMADVHSSETAIQLSKLNIQKEILVKYDLAQLQIELKGLFKQERIIKEKLKHLVLKSPASGIILTEGIESLSSSYVQQGAKLMDIAETKNWDAVLFVKEDDINRVKINDKVKIKLTALQSEDNYRLFNASIMSIGAEKINNNNVSFQNYAGLYRVTVKVNFNNDKSDLSRLKYEYKVNGEIITDSGRIIDLLIRYFRKII